MMNEILKHHLHIFDMDGLLLDTERIAFEIFKCTCKEFGFIPSIKSYLPFISVDRIQRYEILSQLHSNIPIQKIVELWDARYMEYLYEKQIPLKRGVQSMLNYLKKNKKLIAVATSTDSKLAKHKLRKSLLLEYFDYIVAGDQVRKSKPSPEIYNTVIKYFNMPKDSCLAYEDSLKGIESAYQAGLNVIQIIDLQKPTIDSIKKTIFRFDSFDSLFSSLNLNSDIILKSSK